MEYLLDTNAVSDLIRKDAGIVGRLRSLGTNEVLISATVRGEILYGIRKMPAGRKRDELARLATSYLEMLRCVPVPVEAADHYAEVKVLRARAGLALDENDLWIAATALAVAATLVTRDNDFQGISGLKIEDWTTGR